MISKLFKSLGLLSFLVIVFFITWAVLASVVANAEITIICQQHGEQFVPVRILGDKTLWCVDGINHYRYDYTPRIPELFLGE